MKKVLLVSLVSTNFGNRLQQFALQRTIEDMGFEVDLLERRTYLPKQIAKWGLRKISIICGNGVEKAKDARKRKFLKKKGLFYKNHKYILTSKLYKTDWKKYVYAITGSDQVWHGTIPFFYLDFIEESKRISYAPSFGFSAFPEDELDDFHQRLMGIHKLSCREQSGCELIRELTGREAQRVLDPTLLLTGNEWAMIESKPEFAVPEKYLLINVLGNMPSEYEYEIKRIAKGRGLQIVNISDWHDIKHYAVSPDEFLWLVHHADTICTDSFHTAVFSVLFEKNLRVFRRRQENFNDMFGRLHDLLEPLGLLNTVYGDGDSLSTVLNERGKAYLVSEREKSLKYLRNSLHVQ